MAGTAPLHNPVDSLEPTLALVLKETGKFFRATQSNDARQVGIARMAICQTIPSANLRFHDVLDDLETEIIRAKSVFERDLSTIRTKRAERERAAAGILRARNNSGVVKSNASTGSPKVAPAAAPQPETQKAHEQPPPSAEDDMKGERGMTEPDPLTVPKLVPDTTDVISGTIKTEPFSIPESLPQDPNEPKGLAISLDQTPSAPAPTDPPKTEPETTNVPDDVSLQMDAVPPNLSSADFESMFEDSELPGASDEINFDLAFPSDNANDPTGLMHASTFDDLPLNSTETPANPNLGSAGEDLTTLLPGLENYVNDSNDFQLSDIPGANLFDNSHNDNSVKAEDNPSFSIQGNSNAQDIPTFNPPVIESSFEDMFGMDSYMNGTGDDELGGTADFDEDWFKTDAM
ncbi:MAG: hypothetical protein Q9169_006009 [Polycauliona sp. 2 TL-2023]